MPSVADYECGWCFKPLIADNIKYYHIEHGLVLSPDCGKVTVFCDAECSFEWFRKNKDTYSVKLNIAVTGNDDAD